MCVIIAKAAGVEPVKEEYLSKAWDSNSHGGGVVFKKAGEDVKVKKGFMNKEEFLNYLKDINTKDTAFIAHFRIKSVGEVKPENCHPFVAKNVTYAHNGTLHIQPFDGKTDTETFGTVVFKNHTLNWIKENQFLIEMALDHSKFAVMDNKTGEIFILNKEYGKERDGVWYSNESAFPVPKPTYSGYYGNYNCQNKGGNKASSSADRFWDDDTWNQPYRPQANWGTKKWRQYGCTFNNDTKCWVNDYTHQNQSPLWCDGKIVINKQGFYVLDKDFAPGEELKDHQYQPNDDVVQMIIDERAFINNLLNEYREATFESYPDRCDTEMQIQERYFVLNGIRRLVAAKKEVNLDSLYGYIYAGVLKKSPIMSQYLEKEFASFDEDVALIIDEWAENLAIADEAQKLQVA